MHYFSMNRNGTTLRLMSFFSSTTKWGNREWRRERIDQNLPLQKSFKHLLLLLFSSSWDWIEERKKDDANIFHNYISYPKVIELLKKTQESISIVLFIWLEKFLLIICGHHSERKNYRTFIMLNNSIFLLWFLLEVGGMQSDITEKYILYSYARL